MRALYSATKPRRMSALSTDRNGRKAEPLNHSTIASRTGHHMVVDGVPDVEVRAERLEQIVIGRRCRQIVARRCRQPDLRGPRAAFCHLAHEGERRLVGVVRHLQRQHAAFRQPLEQTPQHRRMIGNPLKHRVGEQQVGALRRIPGGEIGLGEGAVGQPFARLAQHVGRGIDSDDLGLRIACDQQLGGIAGPAAEIDHAAGRLQRHLREQIARRPRALVLELEILARAPVFGHQNIPLLQRRKMDW